MNTHGETLLSNLQKHMAFAGELNELFRLLMRPDNSFQQRGYG